MSATAVAVLIGQLLAILSTVALFAIAVIERVGAHTAGEKPVPASKLEQFGSVYVLLGLPALYVFLRLPCSSWPWLIEHPAIGAVLSGGMLVGGACLVGVLSKLEAARWHQALRAVGKLLMVAGVVGLIGTAFVGAGCRLQSDAAPSGSVNGQPSSSSLQNETPLTGMVRGVASRLARSVVAGEDAVEALREYVWVDEAASPSRRAFTRLTKGIEVLSRSMSVVGVAIAGALCALLILAIRGGVDAWSARSGWRRVLCALLVGLAGLGLLPFCLSLIAVYLGQFLAPPYLVSLWLAGLSGGIVVTLWLMLAPAVQRRQPAIVASES